MAFSQPSLIKMTFSTKFSTAVPQESRLPCTSITARWWGNGVCFIVLVAVVDDIDIRLRQGTVQARKVLEILDFRYLTILLLCGFLWRGFWE
jgi:hypothetical protein